MPCNGDYHPPTERLVELAKVCYLLDELNRLKPPDSHTFKSGHHPSCNIEDLSTKQEQLRYEELCNKLTGFSEVYHKANHSLEMQLWWRDHKIADKIKEKRKVEEKKLMHDKITALAKLTTYEKTILKIKDGI